MYGDCINVYLKIMNFIVYSGLNLTSVTYKRERCEESEEKLLARSRAHMARFCACTTSSAKVSADARVITAEIIS